MTQIDTPIPCKILMDEIQKDVGYDFSKFAFFGILNHHNYFSEASFWEERFSGKWKSINIYTGVVSFINQYNYDDYQNMDDVVFGFNSSEKELIVYAPNLDLGVVLARKQSAQMTGIFANYNDRSIVDAAISLVSAESGSEEICRYFLSWRDYLYNIFLDTEFSAMAPP